MLTILHLYPLNELISNLIPATGLKKVGTGQQRAEKARHVEMIQLGEHLIKLIDIRSVTVLAIKGMS